MSRNEDTLTAILGELPGLSDASPQYIRSIASFLARSNVLAVDSLTDGDLLRCVKIPVDSRFATMVDRAALRRCATGEPE